MSSASTLEIDILAKFKNEMDSELNKAKQSMNSLKTTTNQWQQEQKKANEEVVKSTSGLRSWASSLPAILTSVTSLATAILNMGRSYRDLANAQTQVDRAALRVSKSQEAYNKAQEKVNKLIAEGKQGTPEYAQALLDLQQAEAKLQIDTESLTNAQQKQSDAYQDFYLSIIPTALGAMGSIGTIIQQVSEHQQRHALALAAAGKETKALTTAQKLMRVGMIAIPFAAIAAGFLAIRNNTFGVRDELDKLGANLGKEFPQFKGFLQWVKDLGEALGLTGKNLDLSKAWKLFVDGFNSAVTTVQNTDWTAVMNTIGQKIEEGIKNFDWDAAWQSFKDALAATGRWLAPILAKMGKAILDFIAAEGPKWWAGFQEALGATGIWLGQQIAKLGGAIVTEIKKVGAQWWEGFLKALSDPSNLALLISPIGLIGTAIAKEIIKVGPGWWEGFRVGLGKSVEWVATQMANIGDAILKFDWGAIGSGIWTKIAQGIQGAIGSLGEAGKGIQDWFSGLFGGGKVEKTAFGGGGGGLKKVDETGAVVEQLTGGGGGGGGLGIAELFAKEMQMAIQFVTNGTAQMSAQFLTMKTSITATMTQLQTSLGAFASTALTTIVTAVSTQTTTISAHFLTMKTSVMATMTQLQTALGAFASTALTTLVAAVGQQTTTISAHFLTMNTSITTTLTGLQTKLTAFVSGALSTMAASVGKQTTVASAHFVTMSTSIAGSITKASSSLTALVSAASTMASGVVKHTTSVSGSFNAMASSISSSCSKASSQMSSLSSAIAKVASQASAATAKVKQLASAINALKSKSITIHVGLSGPGASFVQHGGSFITGLNPKARPGGQHGYSGIVNKPTTFKGVRMGEAFRPELVTVTPLTRGTGNHRGPTMGGGPMGGAGGAAAVVNVTVVLDGQVIQRFVEKVALAGIGAQI